jgi:ornithine decarboxylase
MRGIVAVDGQSWAAASPTRYLKPTCRCAQAYGEAIFEALSKHFGNQMPETIIEPGRGMVGNAGRDRGGSRADLEEEPRTDEVRWVYLDIGKFGGLAETMDEAIRYPIERSGRRRGREVALRARRPDLRFGRRPVREDAVHAAAVSWTIGDEVLIEGTGRLHDDLRGSVAFNGFEPLIQYVI